MPGNKRKASNASPENRPSLASCIISEREKVTHLAIAARGMSQEGGTGQELLPYSQVIRVNSLSDSVVAGIVIELDSTLVGILIATEALPNVITGLQTHHLQRIAGQHEENISTSDIRYLRQARGDHACSELIGRIDNFENNLFDRAKALNRELSGESYYPPERERSLPPVRNIVEELGFKGSDLM